MAKVNKSDDEFRIYESEYWKITAKMRSHGKPE
jgi:hypothetical protein